MHSEPCNYSQHDSWRLAGSSGVTVQSAEKIHEEAQQWRKEEEEEEALKWCFLSKTVVHVVQQPLKFHLYTSSPALMGWTVCPQVPVCSGSETICYVTRDRIKPGKMKNVSNAAVVKLAVFAWQTADCGPEKPAAVCSPVWRWEIHRGGAVLPSLPSHLFFCRQPEMNHLLLCPLTPSTHHPWKRTCYVKVQ